MALNSIRQFQGTPGLIKCSRRFHTGTNGARNSPGAGSVRFAHACTARVQNASKRRQTVYSKNARTGAQVEPNRIRQIWKLVWFEAFTARRTGQHG